MLYFKSLQSYRPLFEVDAMNILAYILLLIVGFIATNIKAATVPSTKANTETETIEVTTSPYFTSNNIQTINRDEFIASAKNLADILQSVNGLQIRQIGGIGNPVSVSIRGSSNKQIQLYIDGQLVNNNQSGGFDLNQIPVEHIESIEISKNQSLGTGSTPIGGTIRINTYNPTSNITKLALSGGSFNFKEFSLTKNHAFKNHNLAYGFNHLTTDNDYNYLVPQNINNTSESIEQPIRNNQFKKQSAFINSNSHFENHLLRFNIQYNKQNKALPNYQNNNLENNSQLSSDNIRYGYQHVWLSQLNWLETIEVDLYHDNKNEEYLNNPTNNLRELNFYQNDKRHAEIKPLLTFSNQNNNLNVIPFLAFSKQRFSSISLNNNGQVKPCNPIRGCDTIAKQYQLTSGARVEWQSLNTPLSSYFLFSKQREKNTNQSLDPVSAERLTNQKSYQTKELGVSYQNNNLQTELNISQGLRTPTLFELFGDRGLFKGNDNLLPEEAKTINLGQKYQLQKQNKQYLFELSIYHQQLENSIVAIFSSQGVGQYTNLTEAKLTGLEAETSIPLSDSWQLSLQANYIDSQSNNNKKLPGIYHQQFSADIQYKINSRWKLQLNHSIDKDLYFNRENIFENKQANVGNGNPANRYVSDVFIHWQQQKITASFSFNNIFNNQYQDLANRPAEGRSLQFKLTIKGI